MAPAGLAVNPATLPGARERPDAAQAGGDGRELLRLAQDRRRRRAARASTWWTTPGSAVWLVDPGINGAHPERPDGSDGAQVRRAQGHAHVATSSRASSTGELPWGLVLFGVMIALVLEMSGIPSLAFAVGVYLPLSSSTPIFLGGLVRWLVDCDSAPGAGGERGLTEEELAAEADKSPGVLMASGYIAGGAIAGIVIAFMAGVLEPVDRVLGKWAAANNPFFEGPLADLLALLPFALLTLLLLFTGWGLVLRGRGGKAGAPAR